MKKLLYLIGAIFLIGLISAYSTTFNPFTGKLDYVGIGSENINVTGYNVTADYFCIGDTCYNTFGGNSSWNESHADTLYYSILNPYGFYNSTDFNITDYYTKSNINNFNYWNSTSNGFNETYADGLYVNVDGDNMTGNLNMSGNNITNISNLVGSGDNIVIGDAGVDSHSLTSDDDLFVSGKLEVDGTIEFDSLVSFNPSGGLSSWVIKESGNSFLGALPIADDGVHFGIVGTDGRSNYNLIFTDYANREDDYDHSIPSTNPTIFLHSATDPDTDNTQWGSLSHDTQSFQIDSGTNMTEITSQAEVNQELYAGDDLIVGDPGSEIDLFTISVNGTHVVINSSYGLPVSIGNATDIWATFLSNGTLQLNYGCIGC